MLQRIVSNLSSPCILDRVDFGSHDAAICKLHSIPNVSGPQIAGNHLTCTSSQGCVSSCNKIPYVDKNEGQCRYCISDAIMTHQTITATSSLNCSCKSSSKSGTLPMTWNHKGAGVMANEIWRERLKLLEGYFDASTILVLRQTARIFNQHRYRLGNDTVLLSSLRGYDPKLLVEKALPAVCRSLHSSSRERLRLDFRSCTLLKDVSLARLVDLSYGLRIQNAIWSNVCSLNLDFCYQITDQGLSALLTTHMPFLEELTFSNARNKQLTGLPLKSYLSSEHWPRFISFDCSFTNMWLEPVACVARFITERAFDIGAQPHIQIFGSWASKCLLEKLGFGTMSESFCRAVKGGDYVVASKLTKAMQKDLLETGNKDGWLKDSLVQLVKHYGSELLVNSPLTIETSEVGGVNVWTLPISIAIQTEDHNTFNLLLKRGAKVDVWDYLGKSPIFRACEVDRHDFVEVLLSQGASPVPHDLAGLSPLDVSIRHKNTTVVNLLLKHGAILDFKCPAVKAYKSALCVACEINAPEMIQLFLEKGGNPNWNTYNKYTPTLLAYQLNSAWLPHFLEANAGYPINMRWVLTEIMSCAIMKTDLNSVKLLIKKYPDLLHKSHQMWSKPHIQASKLGKCDILEYLLVAGAEINGEGDTDGQTALHAAAEEGYLDCVELLISKGADINKTNCDGQSPLQIACLENRFNVGERLLRQGCDVNIRDKAFRETALMICIRMRNEKMAMLILRCGTNHHYDAIGPDGKTALMYAMLFGQYAIADMLMEKGADVTVRDDNGDTAYSIVCERLLTPGSDKKVLRRFIRLYKSSKRKANIWNGVHLRGNRVCRMNVANNSESNWEENKTHKNMISQNQTSEQANGVMESMGINRIDTAGTRMANSGLNAPPSSLGKTGKKLKLEPKAVLSAAKGLPTAILRVVKAK